VTDRTAAVIDSLGSQICAGLLPAGRALTVEAVEQANAASRTVVREALRHLAALGLVRPRRRIGYEVQPPAVWNMAAPDVARWRLASADRDEVLDELYELRVALEPIAARTAASRMTPRAAQDLSTTAGSLWAASEAGQHDDFIAADKRLHETILALSGNHIFQSLAGVITTALPERAPAGRPIDRRATRLHLDLVEALIAGDASRSENTMREIVSDRLLATKPVDEVGFVTQ